MRIRLEFLREELDRVAFITLKKNITVGESIMLDKEIPMPTLTKVIRNKIFESDPVFNQNELVDGIIFLLGIDPEFKYAEYYISIIKSLHEHALEIEANRLFSDIDDDNKLDRLIELVGLVHLGFDQHEMLSQVGRLAVEIYNGNENEEFNQLAYRIFRYMEKEDTILPMPYYYLGYHAYNKAMYSNAKKYWEISIEKGLSDTYKTDLIEIFPKLKSRMLYEEGYELIFKGRYQEGVE
jgi:hypothetical protein